MRIGDLEFKGSVFLAPMAGITDTPFRRLVQMFGVSALWTEMISANGLVSAREQFRTMRLDGHQVPTVFQLSGKDPEIMAKAAEIVQDEGASAIDINMGCPAKKVVGKGLGAALMKDAGLAGKVVAAVRRVSRVPVTVKMRAGWDESAQNAPDLAGILESEGADALIIHSRVRSKRHSGPAIMPIIAEVKQKVKIPVIGNGGIIDMADARTMAEETGCDGLMIGRGALGRPWFPGQVLAEVYGVPHDSSRSGTVFEVIMKHFEFQLQWWENLTAVRRMRKHLAWYSKGFPDGAEFRQNVFKLEDAGQVIFQAEKFFGKAVLS